MRRCTRPLLFCLLLGSAAPALAEIPPVLAVCGDEVEFPPWTYFERESGRKTDRPTGYSVEMIGAALKHGGYTAKIELAPWRRCLAMSALGRYQILLDGAKLPDRQRDFLFVDQPLFILNAVYLWNKQSPAPAITAREDFAKYPICGIRGYNYALFGLSDEMVTLRAPDGATALELLAAGRCDLTFTFRETLIGLHLLGAPDDTHGGRFGLASVPDTAPFPFYPIVSRSLPYRDELVALLNREIAALKSSGEAARLYARYLPGETP